LTVSWPVWYTLFDANGRKNPNKDISYQVDDSSDSHRHGRGEVDSLLATDPGWEGIDLT